MDTEKLQKNSVKMSLFLVFLSINTSYDYICISQKHFKKLEPNNTLSKVYIIIETPC